MGCTLPTCLSAEVASLETELQPPARRRWCRSTRRRWRRRRCGAGLELHDVRTAGAGAADAVGATDSITTPRVSSSAAAERRRWGSSWRATKNRTRDLSAGSADRGEGGGGGQHWEEERTATRRRQRASSRRAEEKENGRCALAPSAANANSSKLGSPTRGEVTAAETKRRASARLPRQGSDAQGRARQTGGAKGPTLRTRS